jgi:hypothetical protein
MADDEIVDKLMKGPMLKFKYDDSYLRQLKRSFGQAALPINGSRLRPFFEVYTRELKSYTEARIYSESRSLPLLAQRLLDVECQWRNDFQPEFFGNIAHSNLASCWELVLSLISEPPSFTERDKLLQTEKYQRAVSKITAKYLEQDFLKQ